METKNVVDHKSIAQRLNSYLGADLLDDELESERGFKKIASKMVKAACTNADLAFLGIDLRAFEDLAKKHACHEQLFGKEFSPLVLNYLASRPINSLDSFPEDNCARQQMSL